MAYAYNTSSARDLSVFEGNAQPKRLRKSELKVVKTPRQFLASAITPKNMCVFLMAVTVVCLMVYNYVCLNEVTEKINEYSRELTALRSNHVIMESRLGSELSPRTVAERAENELGLKRMDKYQTEYIYLYHEDRIEVLEEEKAGSLGERAKNAFNSAIESIKEYIAQG